MTLRLILYLIVSEVERYKLEKKRERNRIAATKCRLRKMERISQLDGQVNITMKCANLQTGFGANKAPGALKPLSTGANPGSRAVVS